MIHTLALATLVAQADGACAGGPAPTIVRAAPRIVADIGGVNHIRVLVSVANVGGARQAGNVLQSVSIFQDDMKVGEKGVPPLASGQVYEFPYDLRRADDAALGSTTLTFRLHPDANAAASCYAGRTRLTIRV